MYIPVLYEDAEALVIDKPAGLPLDRPRAGGPSLSDHLPALRFGFRQLPMPVHRLDRDTSGCLLLARHAKALKRFGRAFEERRVAKRYLGIVSDVIEGEEGTITLALSKVSTAQAGWRMIPAPEGKPAVTHWRKLAAHDGLVLVEFRPETGRTHQIRVHAASGLRAPLLGDPIYGPVYGDARSGARTLLHAAALTVPREGKPPIEAFSPLPADFVALGFADG